MPWKCRGRSTKQDEGWGGGDALIGALSMNIFISGKTETILQS